MLCFPLYALVKAPRKGRQKYCCLEFQLSHIWKSFSFLESLFPWPVYILLFCPCFTDKFLMPLCYHFAIFPIQRNQGLRSPLVSCSPVCPSQHLPQSEPIFPLGIWLELFNTLQLSLCQCLFEVLPVSTGNTFLDTPSIQLFHSENVYMAHHHPVTEYDLSLFPSFLTDKLLADRRNYGTVMLLLTEL